MNENSNDNAFCSICSISKIICNTPWAQSDCKCFSYFIRGGYHDQHFMPEFHFPIYFAKLVEVEMYIPMYFSMPGCILCMDCDLWFVRVCGYAGWCGGVGVGDKVSCWHQATPGKLMGQPRLEGERRSPGGSCWGRRGLSCEALSRSLQALLVLLCGSQVFSVRCERSTRKSAAQGERATF